MDYYERAPGLVSRTRDYALKVIDLYAGLPGKPVPQVLGRQLLRAGTSVGAQYREAQRAKSIADFVSKTEGALQEIEECAYWLELFNASKSANSKTVEELYSETRQLISIFTALVLNAKASRSRLHRR